MSEMRDSEVYWLGDVHKSWPIAPAWTLFLERSTTSDEAATHLTPSQHYGVLPQEEYQALIGGKVVQKLSDTAMKEVRAGDFIIHLRSFQGGIERSAIDGKVSNAYTVLEPSPRLHGPYWKWFLKSSRFVAGLASSTDQLRDGQSINFGRFSRFELPVPPLETQRRIADYLDRETAEIDDMVRALDEYLELLSKRRGTVIDLVEAREANQARTRLVPFKFVIDERFTGDWGDEPGQNSINLPCVRVADFDRENGTVTDEVPTVRSYTAKSVDEKALRTNDLLVERSGGGEKTPVGSAILYTGSDGAMCANFIEVARLRDGQDSRYWFYVLRKEFLSRSTMQFVKQTTGIQNLDPQGFYDRKFPVPGYEEQKHIATMCVREDQRLRRIIESAQELRSLLLKRRQVLINDVVTGKKQV